MTCRLSTGRADPPTASRSSPSIEPGHRAGFCRFRSFPMAEFFTHFSCLLDVGDRKSVVSGKSVSVRVDLGGRRIIKKKQISIVIEFMPQDRLNKRQASN